MRRILIVLPVVFAIGLIVTSNGCGEPPPIPESATAAAASVRTGTEPKTVPATADPIVKLHPRTGHGAVDLVGHGAVPSQRDPITPLPVHPDEKNSPHRIVSSDTAGYTEPTAVPPSVPTVPSVTNSDTTLSSIPAAATSPIPSVVQPPTPPATSYGGGQGHSGEDWTPDFLNTPTVAPQRKNSPPTATSTSSSSSPNREIRFKPTFYLTNETMEVADMDITATRPTLANSADGVTARSVMDPSLAALTEATDTMIRLASATGLAADEYGNASSADYDPIKLNGEYFVDWPKPMLTLVFTGLQDGYLEPCGCAGLSKMRGGLSRRMTFLKELEAKNWNVVAIDSGNLCNGFGRQAELKFHLSTEALRAMKYDAIGIGRNDLKFSADDLLSVTFNVPDFPSLFTSANAAVMQFDPAMTAPYRIVERGNFKVGITSVLAASAVQTVQNSDIQLADAATKLKETVPKMMAEKCKILVLIVDGTAQEAEQLAAEFPQFNVVVPTDTPADPPRLMPRLLNPDSGKPQYVIEVGEKGKFAVVLGLFNDPEFPVRYQRVGLDSRYISSPIIIKSMEMYQQQLKREGFAGLGIKAIADGRSTQLGGYVGSKECQSCHEEEYSIWRKSRHADAWKSLTTTSKPPRVYDPECISCHVVGWEPQGFLPYRTGYMNEETTPHLINVGCENCHGPGEIHCKLELPNGGSEAARLTVRKAINPPMAEAKKICIDCHDLDNSPAYQLETYWPKIDHTVK